MSVDWRMKFKLSLGNLALNNVIPIGERSTHLRKSRIGIILGGWNKNSNLVALRWATSTLTLWYLEMKIENSNDKTILIMPQIGKCYGSGLLYGQAYSFLFSIVFVSCSSQRTASSIQIVSSKSDTERSDIN